MVTLLPTVGAPDVNMPYSALFRLARVFELSDICKLWWRLKSHWSLYDNVIIYRHTLSEINYSCSSAIWSNRHRKCPLHASYLTSLSCWWFNLWIGVSPQICQVPAQTVMIHVIIIHIFVNRICHSQLSVWQMFRLLSYFVIGTPGVIIQKN